jgi:8-oxo-dGTP diphosphatase
VLFAFEGAKKGDGRSAACHARVMEDHHVVAVILLQAGQALLCHRSPGRRWYPDVWDFPGGHVLPGERPEDALRREIAEELGAELESTDGGPVLHQVDPQAGLDLTVWVSRRWRGGITNLQPEEHDAIGWFREEQLDGLAFADPSYPGLLRGLLSD